MFTRASSTNRVRPKTRNWRSSCAKNSARQFFEGAGLGIKPISAFGSKRLVRAAIQYAIDHKRKSVTLVHKGNIQKFTEGAFTKWGYEVAAAGIPGADDFVGGR